MTRKPLQDALSQAEKKLAATEDVASQEHVKVLSLQQDMEKLKVVERNSDSLKAEVKRLQGIEQEVEQYRRLDVKPRDLATFKNNKDAIQHYLRQVPILKEYVVIGDFLRLY
jgi:hypothetical protein